ncbi:MAG: succinyl-diaminopimelate desuccinylase [Proteobacteria bacterium]|nr:succinyl-diaminopimelate desuccinylase [Pseudomonadota bacterium]
MNSRPTSAVLSLAQELIERPSLTPVDAGCIDLIGQRLAQLGFVLERIDSGKVSNLWARRGKAAPLFCFAGHTDVVPTGPKENWQSDPFQPSVRAGMLYGRGAADMKSSLAAMLVAIEAFVATQPQHPGSLAVLLTSDEEGDAVDGTVRVVEALQARNERIDYCLVGEPTCVERLGDTIKNGRRGSLSARLIVHGVQGHVAYPQLDFRHAPVSTPQELQERVHAILDRHGLEYRISWEASKPYLTRRGKLVGALEDSIRNVTGVAAQLSTSGGTSDGRFLADICAEVAEFGPLNATIHKIDECIAIADLEPLAQCYIEVLSRLLSPP